MKSINVKKVIMIGAFCVVLDAGKLHCAGNVDVQQIANKVITGKKIDLEKISSIDNDLLRRPGASLRIRYMHEAVLNAMEAVKSVAFCDKNFINEQIKLILDPIRIYCKNTRSLDYQIRKIVEESLLSKTGSAREKASERSRCLILKFLDSKETLDVFFNKNINKKDDLIKFCTECMIFLEDIIANFSDKVLKQEAAVVEQIKKQEAEQVAMFQCRGNVVGQDINQIIEGKKLLSESMYWFDIFVGQQPALALGMRYAHREALRTLKEIEAGAYCDKKFINEKIKLILDQIKKYYSKAPPKRDMFKVMVEVLLFSPILEPAIYRSLYFLAEESLLSKIGTFDEQALERSKCLILKFFDSNEDLDAFFDKNVRTKDELIKFCTECVTVLIDLRANFTKGVLELEAGIVKDMEKKRSTLDHLLDFPQ